MQVEEINITFITNWNTKYKHIFITIYHDGEADVASRVQAGQGVMA
jgi:hypothetical protein